MISRLIGAIAISLCVSDAVALADTSPFNKDLWLNWHNNFGSQTFDLKRCQVTQSEAAQWDGALHQVGRELAALAPTPPGGMYGDLHQTTSLGADCSPFRAMVELTFVLPKDTQRVPSKTHPGQSWIKATPSRGTLWLKFNTLPDFQQSDVRSDPNSPPFCWAQLTGTLDGYQVYDNRYVAIPASGRPAPMLPISAEKFLTGFIAKLNVDLNGVVEYDQQLYTVTHVHAGKDAIAKVHEQIDHAKAQLARLSPVERAAPAFSSVAAQLDGAALAKADGDVFAVVTPNTAYFDAKLPRNTPQLLVLDLRNIDFTSTPRQTESLDSPESAMRAYVRKTDWHRFAKFLK